MIKFMSALISFLFIMGCSSSEISKNAGQAGRVKFEADAMETEIDKGTFPKTTGILVNQGGYLVYEAYFEEGSRNSLNDTRSVTKSITSIVTGQAIKDKHIGGVETPISPFFSDEILPANHSEARGEIQVKDLLTMSSALAANDQNSSSPGNEDVMHEQQVWTDWAINLPLAENYARDELGYGPFRYATVNAVLMGQLLQKATNQSVDDYIVEQLLAPLGIKDYKFQYSPSGEVMTGGGLRLRGIDLLRIGQLVLDQGMLDGKQIIAKGWINEVLTVRRKDADSGAGYGYFFWQFDFPVKDEPVSGWMMAGNGGNMVLVLPDLDGVIVLTRTNYNSPNQAGESIMLVSEYIIPQLQKLSVLYPDRTTRVKKRD